MASCMSTLPLILALYAVSASALEFPLNVDCGTNGTVASGFLNMRWVGDEQYVKSGVPGKLRVNESLMESLIEPLTTVRYFPEIKKNCYSFPGVGQGKKILVRAWFYYGNYDGLQKFPTFKLLFNGNLWAEVGLAGGNPSEIYEMVHITKVDDVSVCLARTNATDVPFINSLEIKLLDGSLYQGMDINFPLYLKGRYSFAYPYRYIRKPDDSYDRLWFGFTDYARYGLNPLNGSSDPIIDAKLAPDNPPAAVVRHAITTNSSATLTIPTLIESTVPRPHYVNFYFLEMLPNARRSFDIHLDGQIFQSDTINIASGGSVREIHGYNVSLSKDSTFTLVRAGGGSTLPPLINAAEFFMVGKDWRDSSTDASDVKALSEMQKSYVQLLEWSGDPCLPFLYAWEWVNCNSDPTPQVTALNLSGYGLTGSLVDFSNLVALQTIDLHNNSLSGSIPEFLGKLPHLKQLNLADNQFTGSLPESLTRNSKIDLNISGNNVSNNSRDSANSSPKKTNAGVVAGATISSLLSVLLFVMIAIFIFKKAPSAKRSSVLLEPEIKRAFSHAEIVEITNNFRRVLGQGGSGNVYYGRLRNDSEVAVKVLKDSLAQGTMEFVSEAKLLMTVHHRCLVSFVGYCDEDGKLILLYEYMSGGNLRQLLSGRSNTSAFLTWELRLQIALRVATGLDYLHSGCYPPIIHRDVKTTNILLNAKMEAKVADFGLSKVGQNDDVIQVPTAVTNMPKHIDPENVYSSYDQKDDVTLTQLPTVVAGTPGYIDPEYYNTNLVTKKSDVYSFGVVLFELITGYPPIFTVSEERFHIVQWVTPRLARRDIHGVADPNLRGKYNVNSMWKVADIAMSCTSQPSHSRPNMSSVIDQLKEAIEVENNGQYRSADAPFTEVQLSSSSSYEISSSFPSASLVPPAR